MEGLENTTRDALGNDTNHSTRLLSVEYGFSKAQDDDSKYEREASKQWREVLELSRDFESLTAKDEKSGASEAGHDAGVLEDLPAQQFCLGSWIGSTTMPGTSRSTKRRRKPAAELIRRKVATSRPCHGSLLAAPQTPSVAGPSTSDMGVFGSSAVTHLTSLQCPALPPTTPCSMYTFMATACPHLHLPSTARTKDENGADEEVSYD
ncbi:hypothetical protein PVAP13_8NG186803 [Panicum virgatum]|uniref:Uncharacterized protein n=1 Tax=Panicum virgatum TaxID=38727 RepID=A0A8T0P8J0_PANVG|nr:hypothetical protein PVAP13_8NG186803 [Panicum virgatum]